MAFTSNIVNNFGRQVLVSMTNATGSGNDPGTELAGPDTSVAEGFWADLGGSATDDHDTPSVHWSYSAGSDVDAGATCHFGDATQAATRFSCTDDGTFTVTISASDSVHDTPSVDSAVIHVYNVPPRLRKLERVAADDEPTLGIISPKPWQVFKVGDPVTPTTNFADDGANDTQTCAIGWDDGTSTTSGSDGYVCGGVHRFKHAGMYTITPVITDDDGGVSEAASVLVIVYDPHVGTTGNGFYTSAAGSLAADPDATGPAHFGFNSQYLLFDQGPAPSIGGADPGRGGQHQLRGGFGAGVRR